MLNYATNASKCRSLQLIDYFGSANEVRCGICDFCLERNKLDLSDLEFDQLVDKVSIELKQQDHTMEYLTMSLKGAEKEKLVMAVRWLLDHQQIARLENGKLRWLA